MPENNESRYCGQCGYQMGPFDEKCPRCLRMPQQPSVPPPPPVPSQPPTPVVGPAPGYGVPGAEYGYYNYVPAGFWQRVAALLLDGVLMALLGGLIGGIVGGVMGVRGVDPADVMMQVNQKLQIPLSIISIAYYVAMEGTYGATLGKMAMGIKIIRADGTPISYGVSLVRILVKQILGGCTLGLMYLSVLFNPEGRGWHDQIAGTRVIVAPRNQV